MRDILEGDHLVRWIGSSLIEIIRVGTHGHFSCLRRDLRQFSLHFRTLGIVEIAIGRESGIERKVKAFSLEPLKRNGSLALGFQIDLLVGSLVDFYWPEKIGFCRLCNTRVAPRIERCGLIGGEKGRSSSSILQLLLGTFSGLTRIVRSSSTGEQNCGESDVGKPEMNQDADQKPSLN